MWSWQVLLEKSLHAPAYELICSAIAFKPTEAV
jgi:hypothetical protein